MPWETLPTGRTVLNLPPDVVYDLLTWASERAREPERCADTAVGAKLSLPTQRLFDEIKAKNIFPFLKTNSDWVRFCFLLTLKVIEAEIDHLPMFIAVELERERHLLDNREDILEFASELIDRHLNDGSIERLEAMRESLARRATEESDNVFVGKLLELVGQCDNALARLVSPVPSPPIRRNRKYRRGI